MRKIKAVLFSFNPQRMSALPEGFSPPVSIFLSSVLSLAVLNVEHANVDEVGDEDLDAVEVITHRHTLHSLMLEVLALTHGD